MFWVYIRRMSFWFFCNFIRSTKISARCFACCGDQWYLWCQGCLASLGKVKSEPFGRSSGNFEKTVCLRDVCKFLIVVTLAGDCLNMTSLPSGNPKCSSWTHVSLSAFVVNSCLDSILKQPPTKCIWGCCRWQGGCGCHWQPLMRHGIWWILRKSFARSPLSVPVHQHIRSTTWASTTLVSRDKNGDAKCQDVNVALYNQNIRNL